MKRLIPLAIAAALAASTPLVFAADAPPAPTSAQGKQAAPDIAEFDKQMAQMQDNMKKMQAQMEQIRQTRNPQARQKLLAEHWTTMQGNMQLMHDLWGPGMMGCCMGGGMMVQGMTGPGMMSGHTMGGPMWGDYRRLTPEQLRQRQYMTDRLMPMQQMMMEHMMQHQQWMSQPPK